MLRKTASALAACAISALLIAAAPSAPAATGSAAPPHLTIVSSLPRTGSANSQTTSIVNGIKMAIEERSGKIGEFEIRYEDMDDASPQKGNWDQNIEAANANKAAKDPTCVGYIGTYNSGAAKIAMPILNKAGLVMVSPGNTYPGLTKPGAGEANEPKIYRPSGTISYFRVVPTDDIQGAVACEFCTTASSTARALPTSSRRAPRAWASRSRASRASTRRRRTTARSSRRSVPPAPTSSSTGAPRRRTRHRS
jgi:branched-chain amino acid transport system substrate-binding protein